MKKVIVTGANGMLGSTLVAVLKEKGYKVVGTGHSDLDITDPENVRKYLDNHQPDVLVNCAAYTNVEKAEDEIEQSNMINGYAPGILAKETESRDIQFIQISTDYVFSDNTPEGYNEDALPEAFRSNQYGESKRLGEITVQENNPKAYILRTSWVFGPGGKNFIDTMLTLAETKTELNVVEDEVGIPSYTKDISDHIIYVIENKNSLDPGFYHAINEGSCSRNELARSVFEIAGKNIIVNGIKLADYPRKAKISNYSILINNKLPKVKMWKEAVKEYIMSKK